MESMLALLIIYTALHPIRLERIDTEVTSCAIQKSAVSCRVMMHTEYVWGTD